MNGSPAERSKGTRIVLADREPTLRHALGALVTQCLGMQVVGEADTATALQRQVELLKPDLAIVGWNLVNALAESPFAALRGSSRSLRIVVLGMRPETREAVLAAGADGFISMVDAPDVVIRVLQPRREHNESSSTAGEASAPASGR